MMAPFGWSLECMGALDAGLMELYWVVSSAQVRRGVVTGFCAQIVSVDGKFLNAKITKGSKRGTEGTERRGREDYAEAQRRADLDLEEHHCAGAASGGTRLEDLLCPSGQSREPA